MGARTSDRAEAPMRAPWGAPPATPRRQLRWSCPSPLVAHQTKIRMYSTLLLVARLASSFEDF
jgi:hypothetical protein